MERNVAVRWRAPRSCHMIECSLGHRSERADSRVQINEIAQITALVHRFEPC